MGLGYFIARTLLLRSGGRIEARNLAPDEIVGNSCPTEPPRRGLCGHSLAACAI